jgi:stage V sporulation protein G
MNEQQLKTLEVTSVQTFPLKESLGKTQAFARVVLNGQLQLTGLRIIDGANGLFVAYPNDPTFKGEDYRSLFYPITRDLREHIETEVLKQYEIDKKS